jgi:hypothetical protein
MGKYSHNQIGKIRGGGGYGKVVKDSIRGIFSNAWEKIRSIKKISSRGITPLQIKRYASELIVIPFDISFSFSRRKEGTSEFYPLFEWHRITLPKQETRTWAVFYGDYAGIVIKVRDAGSSFGKTHNLLFKIAKCLFFRLSRWTNKQ